MSDVGLFPPGAFAWMCAAALLAVAGLATSTCVFVAWLRARRRQTPLKADRFFGYAIGASAIALGAGILIWLLGESGSLGGFSHWIDRSANAIPLLLLLIMLGPIVALAWNRKFRRNQKAIV